MNRIFNHKSQIKPVIACVAAAIMALMLWFPSEAFAQDKNEEVTIIAPYNPTITSAQKINRNPKIQTGEIEKLPEITYTLQSVRLNTSVSPDNPLAARVPGDPEKDLYRSHLRAGFGNYVTPYFELWVNSLQSDAFKAGAHIKHISSLGQIRDYGKSSYSNSLLEAYAAKFFGGHTLGGSLSYSNKIVHRYGYKPDDFPTLDIDNEDIRQVYNLIGFQVNLMSSNSADDAFNYHADFDGYHLFDRYQSRETGIFFHPGISKKLDLFGNKRSQELGLELSVNYYLNGDSLRTANSGIFSVRPYVQFDLDPYRIYLGIEADYLSDTASRLHVYPVIRAEAGLLDNMIILYAGMDGGLSRVSYKALSDENPYVNPILPLYYSNEKINFFGGVKGRIVEIVDYNVGLRYRSVDKLPMFVNDTANILGNSFTVVYDQTGIFSAFGQLGLRFRSDFGFLFDVGYHSYSTDMQEKAWHKPSLELGLETYYIIRDKLTLSANISSMQGLYARTFVNGNLVAEQLDGWLDLGVGGEYRINSQFSAFLHLNNLFNSGYFRWYQYPVQKFNAMAGIGFSF